MAWRWGRVTDDEHVCPNCDSAEHVVPVWYSKVRFLIGAEPDHIGCTECREMVDNDPGELGIPDFHAVEDDP